MSAPAGWYDDPDGVPGQQRWWNGLSWSDVTQGAPALEDPSGGGLRAPTYVPRRQVYGATTTLAPPRAPSDVIASPERRRWRERPGFVPAVAIGGVLLLIVVLALTLIPGGAGNEPIAGPGTLPPPSPTDEPGGFPPGTVRIIDPDAGISYAYLGEGWREVDFEQRPEMSSTHGQYIVTQETTPDGGSFVAEVSSGPLAPQFQAGGADTYPSVIEPLTASFRANYYPAPNEYEPLSAGPVTIDGAPGYLLEFNLSWDVEGYDSTGERVALLLLDAGQERPAVVYISIPNTHAELYGIVDQLVGSIQLLD